MPLVTEFDVAEAVQTAWAAVADLATACPGGLTYGRKPTGAGWRYAVLRVEAEPPQGDSSTRYVQRFSAEITAWSPAAAADTRTLRGLMDEAMTEKGLSVPNAVRTLRCYPRMGALELAPELKLGNDVLAAGGRWWVVVEADRGS